MYSTWKTVNRRASVVHAYVKIGKCHRCHYLLCVHISRLKQIFMYFTMQTFSARHVLPENELEYFVNVCFHQCCIVVIWNFFFIDKVCFQCGQHKFQVLSFQCLKQTTYKCTDFHYPGSKSLHRYQSFGNIINYFSSYRACCHV